MREDGFELLEEFVIVGGWNTEEVRRISTAISRGSQLQKKVLTPYKLCAGRSDKINLYKLL